MKPQYIVVEGPDGSGKSTLAKHLAEALGLPLFTHPKPPAGSSRFEAALWYAMERSRFLRSGVGEFVADRWWYSSTAMGIATEEPALWRIAKEESDRHPRPILVLYCDAPDEILDRRLLARGEKLPLERFRLRDHYRGAARSILWRCVPTTEREGYALDVALSHVYEARKYG